MNALDWHDLNWCVRRMPKAVAELCKQHGRRVVVAGGFIRSCICGDRVNDVDLFSRSKEDAMLFAGQLQGSSRKPLIETDNAITVTGHRIPVQFIHRWVFENPVDVCKSFDFTIASAAIWWNEDKKRWESHCCESFYADLAARRLVYTSPIRNEEAGGSMLRVLKFYQLGYRIPLESLGAVIARMVMAIRWDDLPYVDVRDEALAREQAVAKVLSGLLREVDPSIDPQHEAHLPSRRDDEAEE